MTDAPMKEQEAIKCACVSAFSRDCLRIRYKIAVDDEIDGRCECVCHDFEDCGDEY